MSTFLTVVLFIAWLALIAILSIVACYFAYGCISALRDKHKTLKDILWCVVGILMVILIICMDILVVTAPFV